MVISATIAIVIGVVSFIIWLLIRRNSDNVADGRREKKTTKNNQATFIEEDQVNESNKDDSGGASLEATENKTQIQNKKEIADQVKVSAFQISAKPDIQDGLIKYKAETAEKVENTLQVPKEKTTPATKSTGSQSQASISSQIQPAANNLSTTAAEKRKVNEISAPLGEKKAASELQTDIPKVLADCLCAAEIMKNKIFCSPRDFHSPVAGDYVQFSEAFTEIKNTIPEFYSAHMSELDGVIREVAHIRKILPEHYVELTDLLEVMAHKDVKPWAQLLLCAFMAKSFTPEFKHFLYLSINKSVLVPVLATTLIPGLHKPLGDATLKKLLNDPWHYCINTLIVVLTALPRESPYRGDILFALLKEETKQLFAREPTLDMSKTLNAVDITSAFYMQLGVPLNNFSAEASLLIPPNAMGVLPLNPFPDRTFVARGVKIALDSNRTSYMLHFETNYSSENVFFLYDVKRSPSDSSNIIESFSKGTKSSTSVPSPKLNDLHLWSLKELTDADLQLLKDYFNKLPLSLELKVSAFLVITLKGVTFLN